MSGACAASQGLTAAERLADYIECRSGQIDAAAFQGGLWHGLPTGFISALLALYIAGFGYRLLLGREVWGADLVYSAFRLGLVVTLATSWSAYSTLIYTVSNQGPVELAQMAAAPTGLEIASPTATATRVQTALAAMYNAQGAAPPVAAPAAAPSATGNSIPTTAPAGAGSQPVEPQLSLEGAVLMFSCIGFSLAARLAQALILAAGPLFIAAALFDVSIGLCIGWLRALAALFIAQAGYALIAAIELSFLEAEVARMTVGQGATSSVPLYLGVLFSGAGLALTLVAAIASGALTRFVQSRTPSRNRQPLDISRQGGATPAWRTTQSQSAQGHSRAIEITDAIHQSTTREAERLRARVPAASGAGPAGTSEAVGMLAASPGSGLRRPGSPRASAGASRRDARA